MALPYLFSRINPAVVVMGALFIIFFAFLNYTLSKVFRDRFGNVNKGTAGIISFCVSVLIIFFGRNKISDFIDALSISGTIIYVLCGIALLILLLLFRKRLKLCMMLMVAGAGLILIGALTDIFYQKWFVIILGIVLIIFGIVCFLKKPFNKNLKISGNSTGPKPTGEGLNILIQEAKNFKRLTSKTKNPRFYGSWAMFINYLKKKGYGKSEKNICKHLGIKIRDLIQIFNHYGKI